MLCAASVHYKPHPSSKLPRFHSSRGLGMQQWRPRNKHFVFASGQPVTAEAGANTRPEALRPAEPTLLSCSSLVLRSALVEGSTLVRTTVAGGSAIVLPACTAIRCRYIADYSYTASCKYNTRVGIPARSFHCSLACTAEL